MSEELQNALIELLDMLQQGVSMVGEQIPPLAGEIVRYGAFYHSGLAIVGCGALAIIFFTRRVLIREVNLTDDGFVGITFASVLMGLLTTTFTLYNLNFALMAITAPRLYIIRYLMDLVNPTGP